MFENFDSATELFHGSDEELPIGTILEPQKVSYVSNTDNSHLENILEKHKPKDKLSRSESVFLVDDIDNLDGVGASIDYIYEVKANAPNDLERSDLAWYSEIEMTDDEELQREYALNYWNGIPYINEDNSIFEYRARKATILKIEEVNI